VPRPHKHPSLTCYKTHGCRCDECRELANETQRQTRKRARERGARWDGHGNLIGGAPYEGARPLSADELLKLRRAVGLPDEGPPPQRRGRPRKATRQSTS